VPYSRWNIISFCVPVTGKNTFLYEYNKNDTRISWKRILMKENRNKITKLSGNKIQYKIKPRTDVICI
jgi:hypothetical protein